MRFKTLEIQGFKSFADKTVLTFDSKMTAVVGSNGKGKSNISDALLWVMGEQGAKTLRGEKMEDVIFHGTQTRKPMGAAKVALTIDNSDRALPDFGEEVVVTRKLYRTGESEYLINGEKTRLKDVHTLFMGTGLGRDGYSIIGQGRVDEIISAKPAGRREIFEEAAGVSKFLHQKAEAERELSRAEENLLRLMDIEAEIKSRLPVLEKQAEKAKKARELAEEEKTLGVALSVRELDLLQSDLSGAENAVLQNRGEYEHFEREISRLESEAEDVSEQKMQITVKIGALRQRGESAREQISEADKAVSAMEAEIARNDGRAAAIREQIENSRKSGIEIEEQISELHAKISEITDEITIIDNNIDSENISLRILDGENSVLDADCREIDRIVGELYKRQAAARIYISRSEDAASDLIKQIKEARSLKAGQSEKEAALEEKLGALQKSLDELTEEKGETANKLSGYSRLYENKADKLDAAADELERVKQERQRKKSRFDVLSDVERNMAGYFAGVKAVMTAAKTGRLSEIHGTVADIIRVGAKYTVAAETALGSALQHIVVESENTAKRCIRYLKESNAGRATFLPLTSVNGETLVSPDGLKDMDGFVGIGHEIAEYDGKYSGIARSLLGRTVFAEDIDCAAVIAKKYGYKFKIVTLDGQVINAGGSFTGGSIKENAGIISRKREIETLNADIERLNDDFDAAKAGHSGLAAECAKMKLECEGMSETLTKLNGEELRLTAEISGVRDLLTQLKEQSGGSKSALERFEARLAEERAAIDKNNSELEEIARELADKEKAAAEKSRLLEDSVNRRKEISDSLSDYNIKKLTKNKDIENLNAQIDALAKSRENAEQGSLSLTKEADGLSEKNLALAADINAKKEEIDEINRGLSDGKGETELLTRQSEELEKRGAAINAEIREKIGGKEKFASALAAASEKKSGLERKAEEIKTSLWDNYSLTPTEAANLAADIAGAVNIKEAKAKLAEVRGKLTALGDVNYAAIAEYAECAERDRLLSEQLGDVRAAKRDLEKLIADLTAEIRVKFLEGFNEINSHFGRIFTEMFGGGTARLELTDETDVLNSGIEIHAAPPGKLIKNLIALSGGEKTLVAITIYFAILLYRPTPFCMLDEVDAALDEVNVVKYVNYLKKYSDTTQLMTITHRRSTIEGCDVLYGVFMQEDGVSKLLKQELDN